MSERPIVALSTRFELTFPGRPMPQPKPRSVGHRRFYPASYTSYRDELALAAQIVFAELEEGGRPWNAFAKSYAVRVRFYVPDKRRTDIDRLVSTILDAMTASGAWEDDRLVSQLRASRAIDVTDPRVTVEVEVA